ncbi:hypothetical protein ON010_g17996 [Phytophthora cinnamomi]|nr:hypothetical protein ON010_g17996 [Phytophthora cinnamomi]
MVGLCGGHHTDNLLGAAHPQGADACARWKEDGPGNEWILSVMAVEEKRGSVVVTSSSAATDQPRKAARAAHLSAPLALPATQPPSYLAVVSPSVPADLNRPWRARSRWRPPPSSSSSAATRSSSSPSTSGTHAGPLQAPQAARAPAKH